MVYNYQTCVFYSFAPDRFLTFLINMEGNHQTCVFFNVFAPWQETLADALDGDGGEGADRDQ